MEDPFLRQEFEAEIAKNGGISRMEPSRYDRPKDAE
jgi:hypothetical protein